MSVLDNPVVPPESPATRVANQLKITTRNTYQQLVQAFNQGARLFWSNPMATPEEIAAVLGPSAVEIFQLHGKIGQLLADVKPEAIAPGMAVVGQFTYNQDGTVTVLPPPAPEPQPEPQPEQPFETPEQPNA